MSVSTCNPHKLPFIYTHGRFLHCSYAARRVGNSGRIDGGRNVDGGDIWPPSTQPPPTSKSTSELCTYLHTYTHTRVHIYISTFRFVVVVLCRRLFCATSFPFSLIFRKFRRHAPFASGKRNCNASKDEFFGSFSVESRGVQWHDAVFLLLCTFELAFLQPTFAHTRFPIFSIHL